ncbi:hypothetical protein [Streptomyces sp. NPDC087294]|uniref:hypothetical protein n=1 Tax=Streptomyces sp. NPDC087294 TaxID=3365777 RepID=UPI003814CC01
MIGTSRSGDPLAGVMAGPYNDPVTGERHVLIQRPREEMLRDPRRLASACATLHRLYPRVESFLTRTPPGIELSEPWRRRLTYVRCVDPAKWPAPTGGGPRVTLAAGAADDDLVRAWLVRAFRAGGGVVHHPVSEFTAAAQAAFLCASPYRMSFIAWRGERAVGHATLLTGATDEVTGESVTELVDLLAEDEAGADIARVVLLRAAAGHAATTRSPLIAGLLHTDPESAPEGREFAQSVLITPALRRRWTIDHAYWWAPAHS